MIGPTGSQTGNKVAVLSGARMAFILRPRAHLSSQDALNYLLVGGAYVHGVMDGSVVCGQTRMNSPVGDYLIKIGCVMAESFHNI